METHRVNQVLILAGGFGTRMSKAANPRSCKPLIEIEGQPILGHLIDVLKEAGIENFVIKGNHHCDDRIKAILEEKKLTSATLFKAETGFRDTPYAAKSLLDERFLLICGHHLVTVSHVKRMLDSSNTAINVISCYSNALFPLNKERRILCNNGRFKSVFTNDPKLPTDYWYARNPYIVHKDILDMTHQDRFNHTFSYYMLKAWEDGMTMNYVEADMPPEFDDDNEFRKVQEFLKNTTNSTYAR